MDMNGAAVGMSEQDFRRYVRVLMVWKVPP